MKIAVYEGTCFRIGSRVTLYDVALGDQSSGDMTREELAALGELIEETLKASAPDSPACTVER